MWARVLILAGFLLISTTPEFTVYLQSNGYVCSRKAVSGRLLPFLHLPITATEACSQVPLQCSEGTLFHLSALDAYAHISSMCVKVRGQPQVLVFAFCCAWDRVSCFLMHTAGWLACELLEFSCLCLSYSHGSWDYRCVQYHIWFSVGSRIRTQVLVGAWQALYPLIHFPSPDLWLPCENWPVAFPFIEGFIKKLISYRCFIYLHCKHRLWPINK